MMKIALSLALVPAIAMAQGGVADSIMAACIARDTSTAWVQASMAWSNEQPGSWSNDSLRLVLIEMAEADQAARPIAGYTDSMNNAAFVRRMAQQDSMRMAQLRGIIRKFGWPTRSLVGARGASAAFLIAQHNEPIQQEALKLMQALPKGQVQLSELAMLEDRVLATAGRPQKYGTQFKPPVGETLEFYPIDSVPRLETRRATVGLPPMGVYLCMMRGFTGKAPRFPP
ncbi:MAG: DUF6624 domain-containing protein [Gemmatimonadaceae bacterium]